VACRLPQDASLADEILARPDNITPSTAGDRRYTVHRLPEPRRGEEGRGHPRGPSGQARADTRARRSPGVQGACAGVAGPVTRGSHREHALCGESATFSPRALGSRPSSPDPGMGHDLRRLLHQRVAIVGAAHVGVRGTEETEGRPNTRRRRARPVPHACLTLRYCARARVSGGWICSTSRVPRVGGQLPPPRLDSSPS
jgi:hypothetical protein